MVYVIIHFIGGFQCRSVLPVSHLYIVTMSGALQQLLEVAGRCQLMRNNSGLKQHVYLTCIRSSAWNQG